MIHIVAMQHDTAMHIYYEYIYNNYLTRSFVLLLNIMVLPATTNHYQPM